MICKWCGEQVEAGASLCAHCGRELPPLSECGGFYNIMPEARLAQVRAPQNGNAPQTHSVQEPAAPAAPAAEKPSNRSTPWFSTAAAARTESARARSPAWGRIA